MTVPQLLHTLAERFPGARWRWSEAFKRYQLDQRPELELEPLDGVSHFPKRAGRPPKHERRGPDGKKTEVVFEPAPRPRYKLYLGGVPARVRDEHVKLLNDIGDSARSYVINTVLSRLECVLAAAGIETKGE